MNQVKSTRSVIFSIPGTRQCRSAHPFILAPPSWRSSVDNAAAADSASEDVTSSFYFLDPTISCYWAAMPMSYSLILLLAVAGDALPFGHSRSRDLGIVDSYMQDLHESAVKEITVIDMVTMDHCNRRHRRQIGTSKSRIRVGM